MKTSASELTAMVFGNLREIYMRRVPYARRYVELVSGMGGSFVPDHLAFRTFNTTTGEQPAGIRAIGHLLKTLNYRKSGTYRFEKQKLSAVHYEHTEGIFPKIFVSQLEVEELPEWAGKIIHEVVDESPYLMSDMAIELMNCLASDGCLNEEAAEILSVEMTGYFRRPWKMPSWESMLKINDISQYAAWVLLHGNSVNHFAALVNQQQTPVWPDLEATCNGLIHAGIPMKKEIEGEEGGLLRQSATMPVVESYLFPGMEGEEKEMEWTYAYFELTERGWSHGGDTPRLFQGFVTDQARHLFKMTQTRIN